MKNVLEIVFKVNVDQTTRPTVLRCILAPILWLLLFCQSLLFMDSINSDDFSPINFHTAMETPCKDTDEAPLLPRTSTPYSHMRNKSSAAKSLSFSDAEPRVLCGTVHTKSFVAVVLVIELLLLALFAQILLSDARRDIANGRTPGGDIHRFTVFVLIGAPVILLAMVAISISRAVLLLPYLLVKIAINLLLTTAAANVIRTHWSEISSHFELIVPNTVALLIPYIAWTYITYVTLRLVFTMRHVQNINNMEKKQRDVERPTTDDEDIIVFERPRSSRSERKVRFSGLMGKKQY